MQNTILQRLQVRQNERAVLLHAGDFARILPPGRHWLKRWRGEAAEVFATDRPEFRHALTPTLLQLHPEVVAEHFVGAVLGGQQIGLRYENEQLVELLPPGTRRLYWRGVVPVRVDVLTLSETAPADGERLPDALLAELAPTLNQPGRTMEGLTLVQHSVVPAWAAGVLTVDGQVRSLLPPGCHAFWRVRQQVTVTLVDLRAQVVELSGQEILTRDKVALRLNLVATWRYGEVLQALAHSAKPAEEVYRELQFGLRAAVGTRSLDELLEDKRVLDEIILTQAQTRLAAHGMVLESVGVKDIILPGEMKTLLAQVVEAEKAAQANVIRRREETSATRSLLSTAKVMEGNPVALRMKELETLERVAERIDKISVVGGLDQLLNGLVKLR